MQLPSFFPQQFVHSASAWCVSTTKTSRLKLFKEMIGIYCQSQMKHSQRMGGHCIAYCKLLLLNLLVLAARFEYIFFYRGTMKLEQRITTRNKHRPIVKKSLNVPSNKCIIEQKYSALIPTTISTLI